MHQVARPLPPGPSSPAPIQGLRFLTRPVAFLDGCARRYGDPFTIRLSRRVAIVLFSAPDAVRDIFGGPPETFLGGEANTSLRPLLGARSLFFADGDRLLRARRILLEPFRGASMLAQTDAIRNDTEEVLDGLPLGRAVPIQPSMQRITLAAVLRVVVGPAAAAGVLESIRTAVQEWIEAAMRSVVLWPALQVDAGPWSPWGRVTRARARIDHAVRTALARCRGDAPEESLLARLARTPEPGESAMDEAEILDDVLSVLMAGHETTATALAWAIHYVLADSQVESRMRREIREVVDGQPVTAEHLTRLVYLDAVVRETLRLQPVAPYVGRYLGTPATVGGIALPAGVVVAACSHLTHRRAEIWPEPHRFRPERFLERRVEPWEFFPFGGGLRRCLGMSFALHEMKIVLATLFARASFRRAPGRRTRVVRRGVTLAPSRGLRVIVTARIPSA
jgi:cytochrome P450